MDSVISNLQPASVCQALHLSELLLPRTQRLYDAAVQLAGKWFQHLVHQHLDEFAGLSPEELTDILQEPLLVSGVVSHSVYVWYVCVWRGRGRGGPSVFGVVMVVVAAAVHGAIAVCRCQVAMVALQLPRTCVRLTEQRHNLVVTQQGELGMLDHLPLLCCFAGGLRAADLSSSCSMVPAGS
jgi:hypothetical protein